MDKDKTNYNMEPKLISYPGWSKSDYIKHHGVQNGTISWLENENRIPVNYVLPPGVQREEINANSSIIRQNEQSLSLNIQDLKPMDSRAVYKNINLDLRNY